MVVKEDLLANISACGIEQVHCDELLSRHTTWKIGGPADILVVPNNKESLMRLVHSLHTNEIPMVIIGRGSNLLAPDEGFRGVVIKISAAGFNYLQLEENHAIVGSGHSTISLATIVSRKGLHGLEFAGGIPGNIGGAVYMNAGAHDSDMSQVVLQAEILSLSGELLTLSNEELAFAYRSSILHHDLPGIVLEATFALTPGSPEQISANLNAFKEYRKQTQPWQAPTAGSVFRNPDGTYAAKLIEDVGLKGYNIGGAVISDVHANFMVNQGGATADDIRRLIDHVQAEVFKQHGIRLETEVKLLGNA